MHLFYNFEAYKNHFFNSYQVVVVILLYLAYQVYDFFHISFYIKNKHGLLKTILLFFLCLVPFVDLYIKMKIWEEDISELLWHIIQVSCLAGIPFFVGLLFTQGFYIASFIFTCIFFPVVFYKILAYTEGFNYTIRTQLWEEIKDKNGLTGESADKMYEKLMEEMEDELNEIN